MFVRFLIISAWLRDCVGLRNLPPGLAKILNSGAWTLAGKFVSQAAQLASFIIAARYLTSAEFGFFAFTSAIALLGVAFAEGGWGEYIMKTPERREVLDQVGTIAILAGTGVMLVGILASTVIGTVFHEQVEAFLLIFFSFWILPSSISTVYDGLLIARGQLRIQAMIRICSEIAGLATVAGGIWTGWGVAAMVFGRLVAQLVSLGLSAVVLRWIPRPTLTWPVAREVLDFSKHIVANRLILFLRSYSATLVVGGFLGLAEAGYYRAAERIVAAFSELIGEPARILGWSILRKATGEENTERFGTVATRFMTMLMAVALPAYTGLALVSDNLVHFALGESWAPTALLVTLLSLKQILIIPGYVTEPLLSLSGTIRKMPSNVFANSLVGIVLLLSLAPFGMLYAALAQCLASVASFGISTRLQGKYGRVNWRRVLADSSVLMIAIAVMAGAVIGFEDVAIDLSFTRLPILIVQVLSGCLAYFLALLALHKLGGRTLRIFNVVHS